MQLRPRAWSRATQWLVVGLLIAIVSVAVVVVRPKASRGGLDSVGQGPPGPVVLVPGYGGGTAGLYVLARRLQAAGRSTAVLQLAGDGTGDLRVQAALLASTVKKLIAGGAPSVDVVGYSAGGIVTRLWASELGGAAQARRVVLLGSPNGGTEVAALGAAFGGSLCAVACRQLIPGNDLLEGLSQAGTPPGPQWVSIWTTQDQVVTPPDTARLDGAVEIPVQSICKDEQVDHGSLPTNPVVGALVVRALTATPFTAPTSSDCRALRAG